jgi:hypothetical protein
MERRSEHFHSCAQECRTNVQNRTEGPIVQKGTAHALENTNNVVLHTDQEQYSFKELAVWLVNNANRRIAKSLHCKAVGGGGGFKSFSRVEPDGSLGPRA